MALCGQGTTHAMRAAARLHGRARNDPLLNWLHRREFILLADSRFFRSFAMDREEILNRLRTWQSEGPRADPERGDVRYVLEYATPCNPDGIAGVIRERLGLDCQAVRLSAAHGEKPEADDGLARFAAVMVPATSGLDAREIFEVGYALADATDALTAEPELGTDFFVEPLPPDELEDVDNFPPGCWVSEDGDPTAEDPRWAVRSLGATEAWELPARPGGHSRGEGILVFQPDTGVADHVELEDGALDLSRAYDFIAGREGATDPMNYEGNPGHGTGTASVVISRLSGKIAGSAPLATLVPLRVVERVVVFDHGRVAAAVDYARRNHAHVITMSLGGAWSSALRAAIGTAISEGVIVLAAAGNCVGTVVWPARYEEVIAVAGFNRADEPWIGSCRGEAVDVSAPAEFVPRANRAATNGGSTTDVRGGQGTSFAVALTAGVAALWLAHHGRSAIAAALGPGETIQSRFAALLRFTARRPEGFDTSQYGAGLVDAVRLLRAPLTPPEPDDRLEGTADAAPELHSLVTLVSAADALEGADPLEGSASGESLRRYAAELSHWALVARRRPMPADDLEGVDGPAAPSPTLIRFLTSRQAVGAMPGTSA